MFRDIPRTAWRDAAIGIAAFMSAQAFCDDAGAATNHRITQETTMPATHSHGPFKAIQQSPTGYSTVLDADGRTIGAALTGNDTHARGLPKETVEANARLFAASSNLYTALTGYMFAVDAALAKGFDQDTTERLMAAHEEALRAFAIMEGTPS